MVKHRKVEEDHKEESQGINIALTVLPAIEQGNLLLNFSVLGKSLLVQSTVSCQGSAGDEKNPLPVISLPHEDKTRRPEVRP
ncbi:hypothetical protein EK904_000677, partial [Melospiza melodia maxima]